MVGKTVDECMAICENNLKDKHAIQYYWSVVGETVLRASSVPGGNGDTGVGSGSASGTNVLNF